MSGFEETPNDPTGYTTGSASSSATGASAASAASASSPDPYAERAYSSTGAYGTPGYVPPAYPPAGSPSPLPTSSLPNPGLATLLGFIPGVGAMYNGQFAKGIAHVVIFAVLVSLSDHVNGIFGLLVAGWVFYMVFDAYQTARARRDGLVAPDPFGLNNIGEKFGIGTGPNWSDFTARPASGSSAAPPNSPAAGAPYAYREPYAQPAENPEPGGNRTPDNYPPTVPPYGGQEAYAASGYGYTGVPPYAPAQQYAGQPLGYGAAYMPPVPPMPPLPATQSTLPTGAIWLIGFGVFALLGTLSHRFYWSDRFLDGAIVAGIGIVLLVTRTLRARGTYTAGSAANTWYLLRTSRVGLSLLAIGVALTLDNLGVLTWRYLWPYLLILLGAFLLVERAAYNRMLAAGPIAADAFASTAAEPSSFVPRSVTPDQEGR